MTLADEQSYPDWELLASWVAVIESGSVSDAARLLRISQAAVSQRIKQLENRFETPLLDRSTRPAQPTAAGQRLFEHAKELLTRTANCAGCAYGARECRLRLRTSLSKALKNNKTTHPLVLRSCRP